MATFNEEQQAVVDVRDGQYAILAGPGSGKSTVLVGRYRKLIDEGVPKTDIINLTFSREAAESMMKRASASKEEFCSFHSLGYRICRMENGNQPVEPELRHRLLCKLSSKYGLEYKAVATFISKCRRSDISPAQAMQESGEWRYGLPKAYNEYESARLQGGWTDFDAMLADSLALLQNPEVRARWQFRYVMTDESQDTEKCQWNIARLLAEKHGNILAVGDRNQAIYGFRDAVVDFESLMKSIWPQTKSLYLGYNYRSHKIIVDYVKKKAPHQSPLNDRMVSARSDAGFAIGYKKFATEQDEAEDTLVLAARDPQNSAVLARTNRGLAHVENLAIQKNIRYNLLGKSGFWHQTEIHKGVDALKRHVGTPLPTAVALVWQQLDAHYRGEDVTKEDNDAYENLQILRDMTKKFLTVADFVSYATRCMHVKRTQRGVALGTCHAAKGLEWTHVFLIGCKDGMMPHSKSLDPQEERRIFFVAVSRPSDHLRISWTGTPSPFIRPDLTPEKLTELEIGMKNVEKLEKK